MEKISDILKKYFKKHKKKEIANILGVSAQYLSAILNDKKKPSRKILEKLYVLFNMKEQDIVIIEQNLKMTISDEMKKRLEITDFEKEYDKINILNLKGSKLEFLFLKEKALKEFFENASFYYIKDNVLYFFKEYEGEKLQNDLCIYVLNKKRCISKLRQLKKHVIIDENEVVLLKNISIKYICKGNLRR